MKNGRHCTEKEVSELSKLAIGKSFRNLKDEANMKVDEKKLNKGVLGNIVEFSVFGIEANNNSEPDFIDAEIELKVTPYRKVRKNDVSAAERLSLNIIDFLTEYKNDFYSSHFWFKNKRIQLIWYLSEGKGTSLDSVITHEKLFDLIHSEDLKQIEEDWNYIVGMIKKGRAHELSESDTMYLGACRKGNKTSKPKKQPFSEIVVEPRAFCFKQSYMTQLVKRYIGNYENVEKILNDKNKAFVEYMNDVQNKYKGKTFQQLVEKFNYKYDTRNDFELIVMRMFGVKSKLSKTDEFLKANIVPKTVRIEKNGKITESMSFPAFKFYDVFYENWESSELRNFFQTTKFMFCVFKNDGNDYIFEGFKLWNMPESTIENDLKEVWEKTKLVLASGNIVNRIDNNKRYNNFPGSKDSKVAHVRAHGNKGQKPYPLPVKDKLTGLTEYTRHCFWLNSKYVREILSEFIDN